MVVEGFVDLGWEPVADAFRAAFEHGLESGASVTVYQDGQPRTDLWGGIADASTGAPWERDTVACVFSTSKGITAICAHLLLQRGVLDLDAPVSAYWPEFAGGGKADLPVRYLLTHQAGLTFVDQDLSLEDVRAVEPVLRALGAQVPHWVPGSAYGYHAVTYGHLVGEVIRRVTGKTLGQFIQDELVEPLKVDAWLGLPMDEQVPLARLEPAPPAPDPLAILGERFQPLVRRFRRAIDLGGAWPVTLVTGESGASGDFNDRRVLAVELGASNLVTNSRALARMYAATVSEVDGVRLLTDETAAQCYPIHTSDCRPFGLPEDVPADPMGGFGLGFMAGEKLGPTSFGHAGAGGSFAFADLESRVSFAYVPNKMGGEGDERAMSLIRAVRACLDA
jgi:CubicO group peptidase (beta-lactamase class C family)